MKILDALKNRRSQKAAESTSRLETLLQKASEAPLSDSELAELDDIAKSFSITAEAIEADVGRRVILAELRMHTEKFPELSAAAEKASAAVENYEAGTAKLVSDRYEGLTRLREVSNAIERDQRPVGHLQVLLQQMEEIDGLTASGFGGFGEFSSRGGMGESTDPVAIINNLVKNARERLEAHKNKNPK